MINLLEKLTAAVGVSGNEEKIIGVVTELLAPYGEVTVDALHNVRCTFGEGYHFLLDAHMDEIGFVVTEITEDGFLKVDKCGGIDRRALPASEVSVWGKEEIKGVICAKPPHLQSDEDAKKAPQLKDIAIDTGFSADRLSELVSLGDRVTFKRNFTPLLNGRLSSSVLDDRAGIAAILASLDALKELHCKVTVLFSTQEEVGTRGAKTGAFGVDADEAIAVDVSFAMSPSCDQADCGELSKGVMIGYSPTLDKEMSQRLTAVAKENGIAYQCEIMNGRTGTNADVIAVSECGIKTGLLSIPQRYMHQPVEVVDVKDVEAVSRLIVAYITERVGEINA